VKAGVELPDPRQGDENRLKEREPKRKAARVAGLSAGRVAALAMVVLQKTFRPQLVVLKSHLLPNFFAV
jgi:hypothetical protein